MVSVLVLAFLLQTAGEVQPNGCSPSYTHRVLCTEPEYPAFVMRCSQWANIVQMYYQLPEERFEFVIRTWLQHETPARYQYLRLFIGDAKRYVLQHHFKSGSQAFTQAMQDCGAWRGS